MVKVIINNNTSMEDFVQAMELDCQIPKPYFFLVKSFIDNQAADKFEDLPACIQLDVIVESLRTYGWVFE